MKISIITVVFNGRETIARAIESVRSQSYPNIEHIIIDGGSIDGTYDVIKRYSSTQTVVISEPDQGIYDAMSKGVRLATGELVGILNADDFYSDKDVLEEVANHFKDPELDAFFGDVEYFKRDTPSKTARLYRSKHFHPKRLANGLMPAHPALYLRRRVYERCGLFDISYKIAGDFEFLCRVFKDGLTKFKYAPKVMVRMQLGGASTSGIKSTILLNQEVMRACKANNIDTNYLKLISRYPRKMLEYFFTSQKKL